MIEIVILPNTAETTPATLESCRIIVTFDCARCYYDPVRRSFTAEQIAKLRSRARTMVDPTTGESYSVAALSISAKLRENPSCIDGFIIGYFDHPLRFLLTPSSTEKPLSN